jgi:hypothetical protein
VAPREFDVQEREPEEKRGEERRRRRRRRGDEYRAVKRKQLV